VARIGGPDERFWIGIGFGDEMVDSDLEVVDGPKGTPLQPLAGEFREEALHSIEPGYQGRGEAESPASPGPVSSVTAIAIDLQDASASAIANFQLEFPTGRPP
jgi:hypothetical protein